MDGGVDAGELQPFAHRHVQRSGEIGIGIGCDTSFYPEAVAEPEAAVAVAVYEVDLEFSEQAAGTIAIRDIGDLRTQNAQRRLEGGAGLKLRGQIERELGAALGGPAGVQIDAVTRRETETQPEHIVERDVQTAFGLQVEAGQCRAEGEGYRLLEHLAGDHQIEADRLRRDREADVLRSTHLQIHRFARGITLRSTVLVHRQPAQREVQAVRPEGLVEGLANQVDGALAGLAALLQGATQAVQIGVAGLVAQQGVAQPRHEVARFAQGVAHQGQLESCELVTHAVGQGVEHRLQPVQHPLRIVEQRRQREGVLQVRRHHPPVDAAAEIEVGAEVQHIVRQAVAVAVPVATQRQVGGGEVHGQIQRRAAFQAPVQVRRQFVQGIGLLRAVQTEGGTHADICGGVVDEEAHRTEAAEVEIDGEVHRLPEAGLQAGLDTRLAVHLEHRIGGVGEIPGEAEIERQTG